MSYTDALYESSSESSYSSHSGSEDDGRGREAAGGDDGSGGGLPPLRISDDGRPSRSDVSHHHKKKRNRSTVVVRSPAQAIGNFVGSARRKVARGLSWFLTGEDDDAAGGEGDGTGREADDGDSTYTSSTNVTPRPHTAGESPNTPEPSRRERVNATLREQFGKYLTPKQLRIHVATWNVASEAPPPEGLEAWLMSDPDYATVPNGHINNNSGAGASSTTPPVATTDLPSPTPAPSSGSITPLAQSTPNTSSGPSCADIPDIVVVGLQEVEFGGTALMLETTDASVAWMEAITDTLQVIGRPYGKRYKKVVMTQLVGLTIILISRTDHIPHIRNICQSMSRTGAMAVVGNKGAIGLRATIYNKRFLFITAHFAAHRGRCEARNSNFRDAISQLRFDESLRGADDELEDVQRGQKSYAPLSRGGRHCQGQGLLARIFGRKDHGAKAADNADYLLTTHDYTFFFGDLNYRLADLKYDLIVESVGHKDYGELLLFDELRRQVIHGTAFADFHEPVLEFPPTYKFDKGTSTYDTKKKREPAWTDRILYRVLNEHVSEQDRVRARRRRRDRKSSNSGNGGPPPPSTVVLTANKGTKPEPAVGLAEVLATTKSSTDLVPSTTAEQADAGSTTSSVASGFPTSAESRKNDPDTKPSFFRNTSTTLSRQRSQQGVSPPTALLPFPCVRSETNTSLLESSVGDVDGSSALLSGDEMGSSRSTPLPQGLTTQQEQESCMAIDQLENGLEVLSYSCDGKMIISDHKPVGAGFLVNCAVVDQTKANDLLDDICQSFTFPSFEGKHPPPIVEEE